MSAAKRNQNQTVWIYVLLFGVCMVALAVYVVHQGQERPKITNFAECVAAGNPVMESYPEQCSDGKQTFVNSAR